MQLIYFPGLQITISYVEIAGPLYFMLFLDVINKHAFK
jgi:hypothetical protein